MLKKRKKEKKSFVIASQQLLRKQLKIVGHGSVPDSNIIQNRANNFMLRASK